MTLKSLKNTKEFLHELEIRCHIRKTVLFTGHKITIKEKIDEFDYFEI